MKHVVGARLETAPGVSFVTSNKIIGGFPKVAGAWLTLQVRFYRLR